MKPPAPAAAANSLSARKNRIKYLVQAAFWIVAVLIGFEIYLRFFVSGLKPAVSFDPVWGEHYVTGSILMWRTEGNGITHYIANGEVATPRGCIQPGSLFDDNDIAWVGCFNRRGAKVLRVGAAFGLVQFDSEYAASHAAIR